MSFVKKDEIITDEGYRLAPFLLRMAACLTDAAFFIGSFVLLFFLLSTSRFTTLIDALGSRAAQAELTTYQMNSGLVYKDEEKNVIKDISSEQYETYEEAVAYYYLNYESGSNPNNPDPLNFTIYDYNRRILGLPESDEYINHSAYYEYQKDEEGHSLYDQKGIFKTSLFDEGGNLTKAARDSLLAFYRDAYSVAQDTLMGREYYVKAQAALDRGYIIVESIAAYVPFLIFYVIIPITNVPGQTLGKKFMKLAVADNKTGVAQEKWKVSLKAIPFVVTSLFSIILNDLIVSGITILLVLMISSALMVFTKKRRSLHDYIASSCVIREDDLLIRRAKKKSEEGENA